MNTRDYKYIVGIDEVGRGPIAGPVMVGVFCVPQKTLKKVKKKLSGITDSKQLSQKVREMFLGQIKDLAEEDLLSYTISSVSAKLIDRNGITWAIQTALDRSIKRLEVDPNISYIFLDGGLKAPTQFPQETIIKGDSKNWLIGAASVIAKVTRDKKNETLCKKIS